MKKDTSEKAKYIWFYIAGLALVFTISFSYVFNEKLDLNGDNCDYYMLATSVATGHGYSDIAMPEHKPSALFPPGYPLLMSLVRVFTDSIFVQKVLNGLFLLAASILLFLFVRRNKLPDSLAFVACCAMLLNARVLHFATMMMSEMSFLLFSVFALWALFKLEDSKKPFWREGWFYILIFSSAYAYHIRTQGIALAVAILCYLLATKKWKQSAGYLAGFAVCLLPWMIRNSMAGLGQSRYLNQIFAVSQHRPEEGMLTIGGVAERFFETMGMLISKAIPNTVIPYLTVDYDAPSTIVQWIAGVAILAIIITGFWRFGKFRYFFILYTAATLSIISLFNDPGGNRYITTLVPFLEAGLLVGLYTLLTKLSAKLKISRSFSPWILTALFVFFSFPRLKEEHEVNKASFPPNYQNFFNMAEAINKQLPKTTVVCSRKPNLYYMYGKTYACNYKWTADEKELIADLINKRVDYVILEQLGYSSTFRYLLPAIQNNQELFVPVMHLPNPDTYLFRFDRQAAGKTFGIQ